MRQESHHQKHQRRRENYHLGSSRPWQTPAFASNSPNVENGRRCEQDGRRYRHVQDDVEEVTANYERCGTDRWYKEDREWRECGGDERSREAIAGDNKASAECENYARGL